jgi:hypothetical protein
LIGIVISEQKTKLVSCRTMDDVCTRQGWVRSLEHLRDLLGLSEE